LLKYVRRFGKWVLLAVIVGGIAAGAAIVVTGQSRPTYQATATVQVVPASNTVSPAQLNLSQTVPVAVALLQGPEVEQRVQSDLGLDRSLHGSIAVTAQAGSPIITIQATDSDPGRAAAIANKVVEDFAVVTKADDKTRRDSQISVLQDQIKVQEALLRADAAAVAPLTTTASTNASVAADLAVLTAKERVDSSIYSEMLSQLELLQNNPLEDYQLSVVTPAGAATVTTPHDTRLLKIGLAAVAGVIGVLGVGFLLSTPGPAAQPAPSRIPVQYETVARRVASRR
jgi:capsular polysaccharide biosynthesis protein